MKITIKTLKNQQIPMEVEDSMTIKDLKAKIAETNATMPVDCQQLIIKGKKLDNNDATLAESNVVEGDFMIIMITKPKPVAKAEDAKQEEPKPVISPAVTIKPQENAESVQPVQPVPVQPAQAQPQPAATPVDEEKVGNLMAFSGSSRDKCIRALEAASWEPNLAFEFVTTGIPQQRPPQAHPAGGQGAGMGGAGMAGGQAGGLQAFVNSPQFAQIRMRLLQDPNFYQEFMAMLQQQQPAMYQQIQANPIAFMQLLMGQGGAQPGMGGMPGAGGAGQQPRGSQHTIQVTEQEMQAIKRLEELGFNRQRALRAYIACDKNEEMAANFLFEQMAEDDDDAMHQGIAASTQPASAQPAPVQQPPASEAQPANPVPAEQQPASQDQQMSEEPAAEQEQPSNQNDKPDEDKPDDQDGSAFDQ